MAKYKTILVVTYGRSGSTLLQGLLNSCPGYLIRGENYNMFFHMYKSFQMYRKASTRKGIGKTVRDPWFGALEYKPAQYLRSLREPARQALLGDQDPQKIECLGFKEIRYLPLMGKGSKRLYRYLNFLQKLFDEPAIIFNTRDHSSVANSAWWKNEDAAKLDKRLTAFEQAMLDYGKGKPNFFHISYEDMVERSPKLEGLFNFLGESYDREKIEQVLSIRHSTVPKNAEETT